jgi:two-component system, cell cycle sensor histidine kinase and response regulator CckA
MTGNTEVVLVVDDERIDIDFVRHALEGAGYTVLTAGGYDEAIAVFHRRAADIDMAVIDVSLPRRNGVELAKALLGSNPDLKVLFVSGHVGAEVIRFYGVPATDRHFLKKPFQSEVLLTRVGELLASAEALPWLETETADRKPAASNEK